MKTSSRIWLPFVVLLVALAQTNAEELSPQGGRADVEETIRAVVAEAARSYESATCDETRQSWFPDQPPYVSFAAEDRVINLGTLEEVVSYCHRLQQGRVSVREAITEQTVHSLTPDVSYVVTQSVQTTEWRDGRSNVLPTVETTILLRQDGHWRIMYKHISWGDVTDKNN